MLSIETRIDRAQRLLRMLEQDAPLLAARVAELSLEHQQSAKSHAAEVTAQARAELERLHQERLHQERSSRMASSTIPQAAD
jgi:hypothetical protein